MSDDGAPSETWLLVSDIDDTLTGDPAAMVALAEALNRSEGRVRFAVNSSRPAASVDDTIAHEFPAGLSPEARITAMGTEISVGGTALNAWKARFRDWPHETVFQILSDLRHKPHDAVYQTPRKVSFAVRGAEAQSEARRAIADAGIDCQIIASGIDDFDVIPSQAGKGAATLFLAETLGVDLSRLVVAGDSGNDVAMFRVARQAIAVENARPELIEALSPGSFYHARGAHAAGVLDGLRHYGALLPDEAVNL